MIRANLIGTLVSALVIAGLVGGHALGIHFVWLLLAVWIAVWASIISGAIARRHDLPPPKYGDSWWSRY